MALLLEWEFSLPGGEPIETVVIDDSGTVARVVRESGDVESPAVGWWSGTVDESTRAAATRLAGETWPADEPPPQPAAGGWRVRSTGGSIGLWGGDDAPREGDVRGELAALLAAAVEAASSADRVARFEGRWARVLDEQCPLVRLASAGAADVTVRVDEAGEEVPGAFLNDDGETVGFVGADVVLAPGDEVYAVLQGREPGAQGLVLTGTLRTGDDRLAFSVTLALAPA